MANALASFGVPDGADIATLGSGVRAPSAQKTDVLERAIAATGQGFNQPPKLRRDQKAAIIVHLLLTGPNDLSLEELETDNMTQLVRAMGDLSFVDEGTLFQVIREFLLDIDSSALYFRPGVDAAMAVMKDHLNADVTANLTSNKPANAPEDPWMQVARLEPDVLIKLLAQETPQVCAIVLAKLPAARAAEVLALLDPDLARAATLAAARAGRVGAVALADIGAAIARTAAQNADQGALSGDPVERVGSILNFTPGTARENLLGSLEEADPDLAERMRKIMFTFADIPDRIEISDISKIVRVIDNETMVTALAGGEKTNKDVVEFILSNLSKRLGEQLTEEIRDVGEVKPKDADRAINAVIQSIRDLEAASEIILITPEE